MCKLLRTCLNSISFALLFFVVAAPLLAYAGDITYEYDELGRLVGVVDAQGNQVVYTYDAVGNLLSISTAPSSQVSINQFTPESGPPGTGVTIYGSGFSTTASQNTVTFNGTAATVTSATATEINTSVPAGASTGPITVTTPSGSATSSETFTVTTSSPGPTITGFSPTSGSAGTAVTITGTNFAANPADDRVVFNSTEAQVTSATSTALNTTVPTNTATGPISVTTPYGEAVSGSIFDVPVPGATNVGYTGQTTYGSPTTITLSSANQQAVLAFNGTAGQSASIVFSNSTFSTCPNVTVYTPVGSVLESGNYCGNSGFFDSVYLSRTGTYSILINPGNSAGSVTVTVYGAVTQTGTITMGGPPVTVTATVPGQDAALTFSGTAGQQVSVNITNNTIGGSGPSVSIYAPDGSRPASVCCLGASGFIDSTTLPQTGTYTLSVDTGNATGSITLTLNNATTQTGTITMGGAPVTVTTTVPGQDIALTFSGTAGQQASVNITNNTIGGSGPSVSIYAPDGSRPASVCCLGASGFIDSTTLSQSGTYTLYVDTGNATGSMTLTLNNATTQTGTITIGGAPVTVTTTVPGQDIALTFSGTAGQQVSVNITNNTIGGGGPSVSIYAPDGSRPASVCCLGTSGFIDSTTLPQTGSYTLYVDTGNATGSLTLTLNNATTQTGTITIGGPPVTVTTTVPGQDIALTFSGTFGQQVSVGITNNTIGGSGPSVSIYAPDGSRPASVCCLGSSGYIGTMTLPQTGTYTLYVDTGSATGSMTLTLYSESDISSSVNTSDTYATTVLADTPLYYWRLDEGGPGTAANAAPSIKYQVAGPTSPDTAIALNGYAAYVSTTKQFTNPTTYSVELWFRTSSSRGGKLIGFGNSQTGASGSYDRHIYMTNSGQLIFGHYAGATTVVTSPGSYNDGFWHYAAGTYDGSTIALYVDGSQVASASAGAPQNYGGYWRLGYDNLNGWPSAPTSYYFQGSLGEAAVYSSALTATQVSNHYVAAGGTSYDSTILADHPTSYWKLNESSGSSFADATGGGNTGAAVAGSDNGAYEGGVTYSQPGAISTDSAVSFDGSTGMVQSLLGPAISSTSASIEAWVYVPSSWSPTSGSYSAIVQAGTNNGSGFGIGYNFQSKSGLHLFGLYENVRWVPLSNDPQLSPNTWYHLVMTVDGSGVPTFYINGSSYAQASTGGSPGMPSGSTYVGNDPAASGRFFGGTIDEVAVYPNTLSATQVANHYHASGR